MALSPMIAVMAGEVRWSISSSAAIGGERLAKVPPVPGADVAGWQLAYVLGTERRGRTNWFCRRRQRLHPDAGAEMGA